MATALDILEALPGPAALSGPEGVAGNAAFRALDPTPSLTDGAPEGWSGTPLPDGNVLWRARLPRAADTQLRARERFLATMSHEIRTPLNGVLGMAGLLAGTRLDAAQSSYLDALTESGEHLLSLVNDILDYAKLDAGKLELETSSVQLEPLLQGVCELLSPRAHAKGIEIAWASDAGLPCIRADEGRLRQILFNLAGNAVKFTAGGGVLLTAEAEPVQAGRVALRLAVTDTGPGVAAEAQARVFEEFAHAVPGDGVRYGGAGLGLAIVRRLAEAMGGAVTLDSAPGRGSTFELSASFDVAQPVAPDHPLAGRTVAIVSPSAIVREAAARQVEASGGRALRFAAVQDACDLAPEVVCLVDHAARGDAKHAARPRGRPALILLAPEDRGRLPRYRTAGYVGYLIKPLRRASLAARVLAAAGEAAPASPPPAYHDERAAPANASGVRVLLAEDNPVNALLAVALLKREGCVVDKVADGREALAALAAAPYDLVLMDVRMPVLDGLEAARLHRASGGRTPIVALTANAFEEDRRACLDAGMDDFLTKPLDAAALRAAVARWTAAPTPVRLAG
jgi:signal transduction histidine kinase/CheY-like chemotaxis protein